MNITKKFSVNDILIQYDRDFFKIPISITLPSFFSKKIFKRKHIPQTFNFIQNKIDNIDSEIKEQIITELLDIYLPHRAKKDNVSESIDAVKTSETLYIELKPYLSRMSKLSTTEKHYMLEESVRYLRDKLYALRHAFYSRNIQRKDLKKYSIVLEAIETLYVLSEEQLKFISSKNDEYSLRIQIQTIVLLLAIEALHRDEINEEILSKYISQTINILSQTDFNGGKDTFNQILGVLG